MVAITVVACSDDVPLPNSYEIVFPSTDVAVATETVEVQVFDVKGQETSFCVEALVKRRNNQDIGAPLARTAPRSTCDLLKSSEPLDVSFGTRAFVAIGRRGGQDFVLGCSVENVGPESVPARINMTYANVSVQAAPTTTCRDVSQRCSGGC
jgi:hypothetical protein